MPQQPQFIAFVICRTIQTNAFRIRCCIVLIAYRPCSTWVATSTSYIVLDIPPNDAPQQLSYCCQRNALRSHMVPSCDTTRRKTLGRVPWTIVNGLNHADHLLTHDARRWTFGHDRSHGQQRTTDNILGSATFPYCTASDSRSDQVMLHDVCYFCSQSLQFFESGVFQRR